METAPASRYGLGLTLFKHSRDPFLSLLREHNIAHEEILLKATPPMAGGFPVEILTGSGPWAAALATVICAFLKNRRSRKVIITTKDNEVVHCEFEGLSQSEIERILKRAKNMMAIQTEQDET